MKISLIAEPGKVYVVYGLYSALSKGKWRRHYRIIEPEDGLGGFSVLLEGEVKIVDPSLDHYVICEADYVQDVFVHTAAYQCDEFYYDLIDCGEPEKVEIVFQNMRDLGLEP